MGIFYSGVIVVGLPFIEVCEDPTDFYKKYEGKLERVSPYYDAFDRECLLGIAYAVSGYYQFKELSDNHMIFEKNMALFKEITGKDAKVYLGPWGS